MAALVVDADPEVHRLLARRLGPELDVYAADSVLEALKLVDALQGADLAFVEAELHDGRGELVLERLAHWPEGIRVLTLGRSGDGSPPSKGAAIALQNRALANLVLGKPLASDVVERLKRATLRLFNH